MADEYLLGNAPDEWTRLAEQHALWGPRLVDDLRALGVSGRALDLGCGTGELLPDLAELGCVVEGLERDPEAARRASERGVGTVRVGDLTTDDLGGPFDAIVARWVLSFVSDVDAVVERCRAALGPGGWLVVQDYNHDGLGVWPLDVAIDRVISAYRAVYGARGGDLWVAAQLPGVFARLGAAEVRVVPHTMVGRPGDAVWRWFEAFARGHLPTLVREGQLEPPEVEAFQAAWVRTVADPGAIFFSPWVVTVAARWSLA